MKAKSADHILQTLSGMYAVGASPSVSWLRTSLAAYTQYLMEKMPEKHTLNDTARIKIISTAIIQGRLQGWNSAIDECLYILQSEIDGLMKEGEV